MKSQLEEYLSRILDANFIEKPEREFQFARPRKWRFDFAWPRKKIACEIEGGSWVGGAHNRGKHFQSDCEKYNAAVLLGWSVLRYTTDDVRHHPIRITQELLEVLRE